MELKKLSDNQKQTIYGGWKMGPMVFFGLPSLISSVIGGVVGLANFIDSKINPETDNGQSASEEAARRKQASISMPKPYLRISPYQSKSSISYGLPWDV